MDKSLPNQFHKVSFASKIDRWNLISCGFVITTLGPCSSLDGSPLGKVVTNCRSGFWPRLYVIIDLYGFIIHSVPHLFTFQWNRKLNYFIVYMQRLMHTIYSIYQIITFVPSCPWRWQMRKVWVLFGYIIIVWSFYFVSHVFIVRRGKQVYHISVVKKEPWFEKHWRKLIMHKQIDN